MGNTVMSSVSFCGLPCALVMESFVKKCPSAWRPSGTMIFGLINAISIFSHGMQTSFSSGVGSLFPGGRYFAYEHDLRLGIAFTKHRIRRFAEFTAFPFL